ncbi:hypothetical protein [Thermoactinospora rubra]|nr:hypothetical protein [Thermoactinospora rubra]
MRTLLTRVGRWMDATSPGHAAAVLTLIWLLTIVVSWLTGRAA